jgi:hypothetical protein
MPDQPGFEEMWRGAVAANMRYYEAWGRIATEWLRELAGVGRSLQMPGAIAVGQVPTPTAAPASGPAPRQAAPSGPAPSSPALVLEARAGEEATGAFLVENQLGRPVDTPLIADQITGPGGAVLQVSPEFEPALVSLAAEEQCVVRVRLTITEAFAPGTDYRTVIRGPDLPGTSIPVVLRRAEPAT